MLLPGAPSKIPLSIASAIQHDLCGRFVDRHRGTARSTTCGAVILAGADVSGYAYREAGDPDFRLVRLYCIGCDRQPIRYPTLGAYEVMFEATVMTRCESLILDGITPIDYSNPTHISVVR